MKVGDNPLSPVKKRNKETGLPKTGGFIAKSEADKNAEFVVQSESLTGNSAEVGINCRRSCFNKCVNTNDVDEPEVSGGQVSLEL